MSPSEENRSRRQSAQQWHKSRNSRTDTAAHATDMVNLAHKCVGRFKITRMPATNSSTPDQRTIRRRDESGLISAKYAVDDTRDRL